MVRIYFEADVEDRDEVISLLQAIRTWERGTRVPARAGPGEVMRAVWTSIGTDIEGWRYVGRIMSSPGDLGYLPGAEIWRCQHSHRRRAAAEACARKELARRIDAEAEQAQEP
jgi:hypothetical protein